MEPRSSSRHVSSRSSISSAHSVHSSNSTATLKADGPRPASSSAPLAYAVGFQQPEYQQHQPTGLYGHPDIDMTEMDLSAGMYVQHAPSSSSRHPPVPPARTSSLTHPEPVSSSSHLPTVSLTHATPTKNRSAKQERSDYHDQALSSSPTKTGGRLGYGSLAVDETELITSDGRINVPYVEQKARARADFRAVKHDDSEEEEAQARRALLEQSKKERTREQGRKRQARKRERDKKAKEEAKASLSASVSSDKYQHSGFASRNTSTASLAPPSTPGITATTPPFGPSTSTSSFPSSLPTSASFTSLQLTASPFSGPSQQISGTSSPNTAFSPMTSTAGSATVLDQHSWSSTRTYASRSAVDVRQNPFSSDTPRKAKQGDHRGSFAGLNMTLDQHSPSTTTPTVVISPSAQIHPAKRRRSEPEPELFKKGTAVGLGVMGFAEHDQEAVEYLDSPAKPSRSSADQSGQSHKERPNIRRTASDSAAVMLDLSQPQPENRSPTPPLLPSLKRDYNTVDDHDTTSAPAPTKEGEWFAEAVVTSMTCSEHSAVQTTLSRLGINLDDLRSMSADFAICYDKLKQSKLVKKMKEVSLDDSARHVPGTSAMTFVATTPPMDSAPLSTTSTSSSSPTATRVELSHSVPTFIPTNSFLPAGVQSQTSASRPATTHATPKSTNLPSRARSLSGASLRARGLTLGHKMARSPTLLRQQQDPLVSPMSTTSFQFPNTPSVHHVPESDGASPMMSSVQTPITAQSAFFNHDDIDAAMNASQGGYGGMGGHHRSATDPMGSKTYSTRQQNSFSGFPASSTDLSEGYHRASASSSGLSSPVDMSLYRHHSHSSSFGQLPIMSAPPPHQYPAASSNVDPSQAPDSSLSYQLQMTTPGSQRSRLHTQSYPTSAGAPFTPSGQAHRPSHSGASLWQPNFTPIVEQGTPTRPSSHQATPMMMDHDAHRSSMAMGVRQGEMDQRVLSPNPPTVPVPVSFPLEGDWANFPLSQSGDMGQLGHADPFMVYPNQPPN